jgi:hypothetical protein
MEEICAVAALEAGWDVVRVSPARVDRMREGAMGESILPRDAAMEWKK